MTPAPAMGSGGKAKAGAAQLALSPRPTEGFHRGQKAGSANTPPYRSASAEYPSGPRPQDHDRRPNIGKHRKDQDV